TPPPPPPGGQPPAGAGEGTGESTDAYAAFVQMALGQYQDVGSMTTTATRTTTSQFYAIV
ncbi:hypothetical protein HH299_18865, partial [Xanthomonas sp. Kuri4-2]